MRKAKDPT